MMNNINSRQWMVSIVVMLGLVCTLTNGQCFNGQTRNCGSFCCPPLDSQSHDSDGFQRTECCNALSERSGCCSIQELQTTTCVSGLRCPDGSGRDDVGEIRNQCCLYFRSGCCSRVENRDFQFLFNLTIGLAAAVFIVLLATVFLIILCCCCVCN